MKKSGKIVCAALACAMLVGTVSGCDPAAVSETPDAASVWSTYSTAKVTQNAKEEVPYAKLNASVAIQMMKNETEGTQLIITAGDKAVESYSLETSDLTDGSGHKISKSDISVYHQKYLEVIREWNTSNENYRAGDFVPDMLLPLDLAAEYGENKIAAGQNQGITIEVTTTSETAPGTYTGTFVLNLDGEKQNIPVTVEVWDIEYTGRRSFQSSFLLYRNTLIRGEYEASDELVQRYVDFLLDYNVNTYVIKDTYSVEEEVAEMVRLYENENYSSFCIPRIMQAGYTATSAQANDIIEYIVEVAKISTPENPYIQNVYIYPTHFDEADMFSDKWADVIRVFKAGGEWDKTLNRALAAVRATEEYSEFSADFRDLVDDAVANIPAVFTNVTFQQDWVASSHVTFCPYLNLFGDDAVLQQYQEAAEENNNGDLWAYTCVGPTNPNPTFHIDDYNLGTRVTGWMAKKFGINGYLYWSVNMYQAINEDEWRDIDVYETAERASYCGGDGFLMYPGAYYGSEYPFASIRLAAWRDAMDDYDMLCVYENLLKEKAAAYGITIDFNDYVNDLYDSLFAGTNYYIDDALVAAARMELAERILALQGEDGIIVHPEKGKVSIYSSQSSLKIDGEQTNGIASGNGYIHTVTNTGTTAKTVSVVSDNGTYTFGVNAAGVIASFENDSGNGTVTESSTIAYEGGKAHILIKSVYRSDDETLDGATIRFSPYVQFGINGGISGASAICFTIENTGEENIEFTLQLVSSSGSAIQAGTGYVKAGGTRVFRIDLDSRTFTDDVLSKIVNLRLAFQNVNDEVTALEPDKEFSISDIWYEIN